MEKPNTIDINNFRNKNFKNIASIVTVEENNESKNEIIISKWTRTTQPLQLLYCLRKDKQTYRVSGEACMV